MQYRVLVHRSLKNSRSAIFTPINLIKSAAIALVSGALWFQMDYTEANVFDLSSYFFFTMTYWVFDSMFTALMTFPVEREVILKERSSGSYHLGAYFLAKSTSEMPTRLVLPLIYMTISFWMAGVSDRFDIFVYTTLISLLSVVAGEAIGLMVGASIYDMEQAMTIMTVVSLALMLLGGFFVANVPTWLNWGKYISPFKYSFDASRQLIFDRNIPCDGSGALESLCADNGMTSIPPEDVIEFLNIQGSVGFNVGLLIVIGIVPRCFAYLALRAKKEGGR
jgi:ABC-type multidrug transport system permease subunit